MGNIMGNDITNIWQKLLLFCLAPVWYGCIPHTTNTCSLGLCNTKCPNFNFFSKKREKKAYFFRPGNQVANSPMKCPPGAFPGAVAHLETQQPQIISRKIWHLLRSKLDNGHLDPPPLCCLCCVTNIGPFIKFRQHYFPPRGWERSICHVFLSDWLNFQTFKWLNLTILYLQILVKREKV